MGCDIHIICEVKENGQWKLNKENIFPNSDYYAALEYKKLAEERGEEYKIYDWQKNEFQSYPDDNRSYNWFGVLANVRNEKFDFISEPKGVPDDCCEEWKELVEANQYDYHSHSYLSVKELIEFDWNKVYILSGYININQYIDLRGTNQPPSMYSRDVGGGSIVKLSEESADILLLEGNYDTNTIYYVKYSWSIVYREWFEHKLNCYIPPMQKLAEKYEDVRIVFAFDN